MKKDDVLELLRGNPLYQQTLESCDPEERSAVALAAEETCVNMFESLSTWLSGSEGQAILNRQKNGSN